ncbi:hypothetical protein [Nocardioides sp.]|uniref:hypothetical protein n=1 Tax=Nocardioides sp. TaxID=35761 RepID=UPI002B8861D0|nr:hypothetical protein [Nocardioides sp.]HSX66088.1 hypothetical protein [Nocardioides sp.]
MIRMLTAVLLTLLSTFAVVGASTTSADAATVCGGKEIWAKTKYYDGQAIGRLRVFYNATYGTNCAQFDHAGATWGVKRFTGVGLDRCTQTSPGRGCSISTFDSDYGYYSYYAGPAKVKAPRNCVRADGLIYWRGAYRTITSPVIGC